MTKCLKIKSFNDVYIYAAVHEPNTELKVM